MTDSSKSSVLETLENAHEEAKTQGWDQVIIVGYNSNTKCVHTRISDLTSALFSLGALEHAKDQVKAYAELPKGL